MLSIRFSPTIKHAGPKVKKFMKVILNKLNHDKEGGSNGIMGMVGSLAQEFLKHKLEENNVEDAKPLDTRLADPQSVDFLDGNILKSGCQIGDAVSMM